MVELGNRRVLAPGRLRWLRALGWMALLFVAVGAIFGLSAYAVQHLLTAISGVPANRMKLVPGGLKVGHGGGAGDHLRRLSAGGALSARPGRARRSSGSTACCPNGWRGSASGCADGGDDRRHGAARLGDDRRHAVRAIGNALMNTLQSGTFEELLFRLVVIPAGVARVRGLVGGSGCRPAVRRASPDEPQRVVVRGTLHRAGGGCAARRVLHPDRPHLGIDRRAYGLELHAGVIFGAAVSGGGGFAARAVGHDAEAADRGLARRGRIRTGGGAACASHLHRGGSAGARAGVEGGTVWRWRGSGAPITTVPASGSVAGRARR